MQQIEAMQGVERILPILQPFKLASREFRPERSQVKVGDVVFGGTHIPVIAGPCAVESEGKCSLRQAVRTPERTSCGGSLQTLHYAFQGLAERGLEILAWAGKQVGLPVVTEVLNPRDVERVAEYSDMLQIGARNMQNFTLLREVGMSRRPVLLKRGLSATISEWLQAADYIISGGNHNVVLCERGIRTFETETQHV